MKQKNQVNPMCGKKTIWVRPIYVSERKQAHVTIGWIVSIPSNPGQLSVRQSICCHVTFQSILTTMTNKLVCTLFVYWNKKYTQITIWVFFLACMIFLTTFSVMVFFQGKRSMAFIMTSSAFHLPCKFLVLLYAMSWCTAIESNLFFWLVSAFQTFG